MDLKVVHLAASVGPGGAAAALLNLHKSLLQNGLESSILATNGETAGAERVRIIGSQFNGLNWLVYRELICRNRTSLSNTFFSFDAGGIFVNSEREVLDADIIHLHWVANFLTTSSLSALASLGKPVIWTLHDMRPFTGGCHFSAGCKGFQQECQSCPQLQPTLHHFPVRAHMGQTDVVRLLRPVFVAPSKWLANECMSSSVAGSCHVEVIPYGIDAKTFSPMPQQEARSRLGLDPEALYIMLGAHSLGEKRKGGLLAQQVLRELAHHLPSAESVSTGQWRVVSCGAEPFPLDPPWHAEHLGFLSEQNMAILYAACDVLLFTSQEDNLPNMILEAMACGLPVVAYSVGGVPELVESGKTGLLADPFDTSTLCEHLKSIMGNAELRQDMGRTARTAIATSFTLDAQARRYRDLYARLIARQPKVPILVTLVADANVDSYHLALNALEQERKIERDALIKEKDALIKEKDALIKEKDALIKEKDALIKEKDALIKEKNALAKERSAVMNELAREKHDHRAELLRLRKWNHYLRRQSLGEFVSRNIRIRRRFERKRWAYMIEKWGRAYSLIGKLFFKVSHFRRKT
jgi:glycosyltransferase involved in cell wall biosynthesis